MIASSPILRTALRAGDLGEIIALQGRVYSEEYGLSRVFESDLAAGLGRAVEAGWPEQGGLWVIEEGTRLNGCLAVTFESAEEAKIRWVVVEPELRGLGLAREMLEAALAVADESGRELVTLDTFSELTAAARIYRRHGFEVVSECEWTRWGRPLVLQRYERRIAG